MTVMGLDYAKHLENQRHNVVTEVETNRTNLAKETEAHRANVQSERLASDRLAFDKSKFEQELAFNKSKFEQEFQEQQLLHDRQYAPIYYSADEASERMLERERASKGQKVTGADRDVRGIWSYIHQVTGGTGASRGNNLVSSIGGTVLKSLLA